MSAKETLSKAKGKLSKAFSAQNRYIEGVAVMTGVPVAYLVAGAVGAIALSPFGIVGFSVATVGGTILLTDKALLAKTGRPLFGGEESYNWTDIGNGLKHAPGKAVHKVSATTKKLVGKIPGL